MQQLFAVWGALDPRKRLIAAISGLAMFAAVLLLASVASKPSMAILFSGLDPAAAGEVITALEQRGITHSVQGSTIYVDAGKRDLVRMSLAEEGLPTTGGVGYELLDSLSGFGTTSQMFDAAYWRAKEGELARTIVAWPQVKSARVHIANADSRPFANSPDPVASVTLNLGGQRLSEGQIRALRFLVASAVARLAPEDVSVIDSDRGLITADDPTGFAGAGTNSRAKVLKSNVERLLLARVGPGNAVIEVAVDTEQNRETVVERRFDPDGRVAISTDTLETSDSSTDQGNADVTVASNLPEGDAAGGDASSTSKTTETRERINYEVSETTRELIRQPGKINRLTVAVMVNGIVSTGANGAPLWTPRTETELASLRELVESAVGFDAERGDIVTIKSLEFLPLPEAGTLAEASSFAGLLANGTALIQTAILALVALGLGLFVLRPILTAQAVAALPAPSGKDTAFALAGPNASGPGNPLEIPGPDGALADLAANDPVAQLRQIISERQEETVEVLRNWIETSEEPA